MRLTIGNCDHCGTKTIPCVTTTGFLAMSICQKCDVTGTFVKLSTYKAK